MEYLKFSDLTKEQIELYNDKLSVFIGGRIEPAAENCVDMEGEKRTYFPWNWYYDSIPYHLDWSWLMRIFIAIGEIKSETLEVDEIIIGRYSCSIKAYPTPYKGELKDKFITYNYTTDFNEKLITVVWLSIVEFILWYNKRENII